MKSLAITITFILFAYLSFDALIGRGIADTINLNALALACLAAMVSPVMENTVRSKALFERSKLVDKLLPMIWERNETGALKVLSDWNQGPPDAQKVDGIADRLKRAGYGSWWAAVVVAVAVGAFWFEGGLMLLAGWLFGLFAFAIASLILTR